MDLVLRNNRTNEQYPEGIFHPHREMFHIKKENIGLIEVMGLAILPGRLKEELDQIADILAGNEELYADSKARTIRLPSTGTGSRSVDRKQPCRIKPGRSS